jgi:hypothetical protein
LGLAAAATATAWALIVARLTTPRDAPGGGAAEPRLIRPVARRWMDCAPP